MPDGIATALVSRRTLLGGAMAAFPAIVSGVARAQQPKKVVVGAWGGDYGRLLRESVDAQVLAPLGFEVIQDIGDEPTRMAKMQVQRRLPRGSLDVACFTAPVAFQLGQTDVLEELDVSK